MDSNEDQNKLPASRKSKCMKPSELVLAAIQHLKENKGVSPQEIFKYIRRNHHEYTDDLTKRTVMMALMQGVRFGILDNIGNNYLIKPIPGANSMLVPEEASTCGPCSPCGPCPMKKKRKRRRSKCCRRKSRRRRRSKCKSRSRRRRSRSKCPKRRRSRRRSNKCPKPKRCSSETDDQTDE